MDKFIDLNPTGGLANRMRAIASVISFADKFNYQSRIIWAKNTDLYAEFSDLFIPEFIPCPVENITATKELFFYDFPRKKNLYLASLFSYRRYDSKISDEKNLINICTNNQYDDLNTLIKPSKNFIKSGLNFYPYYSDELYRSLFHPTRYIESEVEKATSEFTEDTIGIHIRQTDNSMSIKYSPVELFITKIKTTLAAKPTTKFFLATDDYNIKNLLKNKFGSSIITNDIVISRKTVEGMQNALTEMLALSKTREIWGSFYSSFSEAAATLGNIKLHQLKADL